MVTNLELAWLAGIWDGEGSITIFTHTEKNGQRKIRPVVCVVNTNLEIIAEVARILDSLGTSFQVFERKNPKDSHKDCVQLTTSNFEYIKVTIQAMLPYLIGKKAQAQLVLRYVNKKLEQFKTNKRPRYDEEDEHLQRQAQKLNRRGKVSDTSTTEGEAATADDTV